VKTKKKDASEDDMTSFERVYQAVRTWAEANGIEVLEERLAPEKAGVFDGTSVTMNSVCTAEERTYYFAHALGSIVRWSLSGPDVQAMFDELRSAKKTRAENPGRLEAAIERYRAFEIESSEFAVWLLTQLGHADAVPSYTNFMRADLEALTEFHRRGRAPVWRDFFARWNEQVACGERHILPYHPRAIPPFRPVRIEKQEILQEMDGRP
jgi:hypothetical protein